MTLLHHLGDGLAAGGGVGIAAEVAGPQRALAERKLRTRDLGGPAGTEACGKAVVEALG